MLKVSKIVLPKSVAQSIETLRNHQAWTDAHLMDITNFLDEEYRSVDDPKSVRYPIGQYLAQDFEANLPKYISALINGFIVGKSSEKVLLELYEASLENTEDLHRGIVYGILTTLKLLDIQVEGINSQ